jgi:hypothetical protein
MAMKEMAKWFTKSWGMLLLGIWLLVINLPPVLEELGIHFSLRPIIGALIGVVAGVLILLGR